MDKREEIREGIAEVMGGWDDCSGGADWMQYGVVCTHDDNCFCGHRQQYLLDKILQYLHSQGVEE